MTRTVLRVYRAALEEAADLYHFHDPELIPIGLLLKRRGKRVIYDVHEDVRRDILSKPYIRPSLGRHLAAAVARLEQAGAEAFDAVVAVTPSIAALFPPEKTVTVQNFPIASELVAPEQTPYLERPARIGYLGGLTPIRCIREMVTAMEFVPERLECRLVMAGPAYPGLESELRILDGWSRVDWLGLRPRSELPAILGGVRAGLVLFQPLDLHLVSYPNKLFEYMSAGIPVIASNFPLWRELVEKTGCGLCVDPLSPPEVAEAIRWVLENPQEAQRMGGRGVDAVETRFNWRTESEKLLALYRRVLRG